jgi:quercetin dioxygenase-like cupin family protein
MSWHQCTSAFYCVDGSMGFIFDEKDTYALQAGDLLLLHMTHQIERSALKIRNLENEKVHVIRADIQY